MSARDEREWPCDKYDEPHTCLSMRADPDDLCRICGIRATDRLLAALADDPAQATLAGIRFRVQVACDGYEALTEDDVPSDVTVFEDYIAGAAEAARAIRAALITGHNHEGDK